MNRRVLVASVAAICTLALRSATCLSIRGVAAAAQESSEFGSATFELERIAVPALHWNLKINADGSGVFTNAAALPSQASAPIQVSAGTREKLAAALAVVRTGRCETKQKNIAKTGKKTLTYQSGDGNANASCVFNYSDSEPLNALVDALLSTAETMQAGERIAQKHRYDRLGLDAELDVLIEEVKTGRALDVQNIAPVLQSVANDERVMERVQRKAIRLLQDAGAVSADSAR